jgi:Trp operon repressor
MKKMTRDVLEFISENVCTPEQHDAFFTDLLTPKEYQDFLDRIRICQELSKGKTVLQVCDKLNVASATVVRGNKVLKYGTSFVRKLFGEKF